VRLVGDVWGERARHPPGRRWVIERGVESRAELEAIVADYQQKAQKLGYVPMMGWL